MEHVAVIGAGSWGTAVAALAAHQRPVVLWARRPELAEAINLTSENPDYLPGHRLPFGLRATNSLTEATGGAIAVVMAVPSHGFGNVMEDIGELASQVPVISLTKGIEEGTLRRMTQVISDHLKGHDVARIGVLTGPNLAGEVMAGHPAAAVAAMSDPEAAAEMQRVFMGPTFRVYTNPDVIGCELAGSLKNVMAIASGMSSGLGFGDNTRAALITRALAELTRLGVALGGQPTTFAGLAGMGDLIATCTSTQSRNHRVGVELARGRQLDDIINEMKMVAEGVKTTRSVLALAEQAGVEMPIAVQVGEVLYEGHHPRDAVMSLMTREARSEV
ncbi:MAG TPA: NAD(P)H-dependent glycerol-3-phosphate dehydrogenase [Acidimicrobiia bacterium]|nr:NAD(P)H-dependent glycerol-3-phosphate dehydrogenase [Acidimicrobiia bacterium]